MILSLKQVGENNTVREQAFECNGVPFMSDVPMAISHTDDMHPLPGGNCATSIDKVSLFS